MRIRRLDNGMWEARRRHYWDDGHGFEEWVREFADYDSAAAYAWSPPQPPAAGHFCGCIYAADCSPLRAGRCKLKTGRSVDKDGKLHATQKAHPHEAERP